MLSSLPREARMVFTVTGIKVEESTKDKPRATITELGWGAIQLFNFERFRESYKKCFFFLTIQRHFQFSCKD